MLNDTEYEGLSEAQRALYDEWLDEQHQAER